MSGVLPPNNSNNNSNIKIIAPNTQQHQSIPTQIIYRQSEVNKSDHTIPNTDNDNDPIPEAELIIKYQSILERLLDLHDDVVSDSITQAIAETIVERSTAKSGDWLRAIFKSVEIILNTINLEDISANVIIIINEIFL